MPSTMLWCLFVLFCPLALAYSGLYIDDGEMTVIDRKMSKRDQRELEEDLLDLLGLHRPPRPMHHTSLNSAPRFLMDVYQSLEDGEEIRNPSIFNFTWDEVSNIRSSDFIMSFVNRGHKHAGAVDGIRHHSDQVFWFDLREVPMSQELISAELKMFKKPVSHRHHKQYVISIYIIEDGESPGGGSLSKIASVNSSQEDEGWIRVNLTDVVKMWVVFPDKNRGLYVNVHTEDGEVVTPYHIGIVGSKGEEDHQPFLAAFFNAGAVNQRARRAAKRKSRREYSYYSDTDLHDPYSALTSNRRRKRACQKLTLFVSFRDLRWQDWIIAPDGYAAFYCSGECTFPLNTHLNATNHAIVQTLVHLMNPYQVPKPMCAPTRLSHISVLYYDDNNNVILRKYRNMVVKTCGCH